MRQRVVIALAICAEPELIIADEPTTALDVSVQAQIISLIKRLGRDHGTAVMLVTHDMGVIAETSDRVAVMYSGRIAEIGPVQDVVQNPLHPYAKGLMGAIPTLAGEAERLVQIPGSMPRLSAIPPGCSFNPRCAFAFDRCRIERPEPIRQRHAGRGLPSLRRRRQGERGMTALPLSTSRICAACSTSRNPGSTACSKAASWNFSRRSTASPSISRRARPSRWSANPAPARPPWRGWWSACCRRPRAKSIIDGVSMSDARQSQARQQLRRRIQMIFQDPYASLNPRFRVDAIVAEPIRAFDLIQGERNIQARVGELLNLVGLHADDGWKYPHEFSGGQRQRIAIARALASEAEFIVCDEPTSALDVSVQAQILNLMRDLQDKFGLTYLFISHNLAVVRHMASRIGVMYLGRIVEIAEGRELFSNPRMPYTKMLLGAVPDLAMSGRQRIPVKGEIPNPIDPPPGCAFNPRCPLAFDLCRREAPALIDGVACHAVNIRRRRPGLITGMRAARARRRLAAAPPVVKCAHPRHQRNDGFP